MGHFDPLFPFKMEEKPRITQMGTN
jgi:hypothetical protein